jgi:hypothetical protein
LNIVVGAFVLKRTWIEDENVIVTKDEPKMEILSEGTEFDDENL